MANLMSRGRRIIDISYSIIREVHTRAKHDSSLEIAGEKVSFTLHVTRLLIVIRKKTGENEAD